MNTTARLQALLRGAMAGISPVMRTFRGMSAEELASRTGMPLARILEVWLGPNSC